MKAFREVAQFWDTLNKSAPRDTGERKMSAKVAPWRCALGIHVNPTKKNYIIKKKKIGPF